MRIFTLHRESTNTHLGCFKTLKEAIAYAAEHSIHKDDCSIEEEESIEGCECGFDQREKRQAEYDAQVREEQKIKGNDK